MTWFQRIFRRHRFYVDSAEALSEQRSNEVWQWSALESIWADTRFALRQMCKAPAFTFTIVLLLGLGIGSVSAVFSIVDAILLKPVPYPDPSSLVIPWDIPPAGVDVGGYLEFPWSPVQFHPSALRGGRCGVGNRTAVPATSLAVGCGSIHPARSPQQRQPILRVVHAGSGYPTAIAAVMVAENMCADVIELDTDQAPQLSMTNELVMALHRFATHSSAGAGRLADRKDRAEGRRAILD